MADRIRVVLVDDAPDVRTLVATRLRLSKRFEVVGEAGTGSEAIRVVTELDPDLLLLDVSMPDMDGMDALARLRELAPRTTVVMFSGFEEHGLADRARELGAADFIEKSVDVATLADRLESAMAGRPIATDVPPVRPPESVLQEHLERFRAAFDEAAIGMATLTLTGRIVRANVALEALVGVASGGLVGCPYESLFHDPADLVKTITAVASGERQVEYVEHDLGGCAVISTVAVVSDSNGAPLYLFLQVQDVSERRAAEEELQRSEERFRMLVEAVRDYAIFMLDPDGHIASWNRGAERIKGYTADEIIGRHFSTFYLPDAIAAGHPEYELEVATREGVYEEEGWRKRKDGSTFWANVVITAVRDAHGQLVGFAKVTRDISERRRLLQELEQAAADRTQLLAVTAHELRTPVSVVKGFASTLRDHWDELDDAERRSMIDSLARGGDRLSLLVDDLFTAARLESGALEVRPAPFDVSDVVREAVRDLGDDAQAIVVDAAPVRVLADRGRVHQMVANYVSNALRYGAPPVTVTVSAVDGEAHVVVADGGPGISGDLAGRLFEKFSTGGSHEGTGLGLFIVRELARAQGGDAWYEERPGGGAAFSLRLPLA